MMIDSDLVFHGDVYACLSFLEDESVAVVITSPPYWKQRNYNFDGQIGQENTPEEYIGKLIKIFNKLRQKLKKDGVFFLNIGDKYFTEKYGKSYLLQIPYRLAYHMVKDGWILEDIIIWYKPNHMPSSIKDRFTNTYEPILVFTKDENNRYRNSKYSNSKVIEVPLQTTNWKHTAVYPENLVIKLIKRINLLDSDLILDPFAGTGTTAVAVNRLRNSLYSRKFHCVLIEKSEEFIDIIKNRTHIKKFIRVDDVDYKYQPIIEEEIPATIEPFPVLKDRNGEIYIASNTNEFLSALKGIKSDEFKKFHREDALFFYGVKNWDLNALYFSHTINKSGYVLRNMIVVSNENNWYPVFMFAKDSTKTAYKFYLDRLRTEPKTRERRKWSETRFIGMKVKNSLKKEREEGHVVEVLKNYNDGFPKVVVVEWNNKASVEFVLHPAEEEFIMEGLSFFCPKCNFVLIDPFDPISDNYCPNCKVKLWESLDSIPIIREPQVVLEIFGEIENNQFKVGQHFNINDIRNNYNDHKPNSKSKFISLDRVNWGASPGARKLMLGEYFTKTRLYKLDQSLVAHYLNLLRKSKNLTIQNIIDKLPKQYHHTVGHWFRKDFGGSIPIPDDIDLLKEVFQVDNHFLTILQKTALKLQTVKSSVKGKNPGDFIKNLSDESLINFLMPLYVSSRNYLKNYIG